MKLTKEQIDLIDRLLEQRNLDFLDFKIEVNDHLACETEAKMETEKLSFEEAFKKTLENWKFNLSDAKNSWIINNRRSFPNFVYKRIRNKYIFFYLFTLLFVVLLLLFPNYLEMLPLNYDSYTNVIKGILTFINLFFLIGFIKLKIGIKKTSFSYMYNQIFYSYLAFFCLILITTNLFIFGIYCSIYSIPFLVNNYMKHDNFIKKHHLA
jgi:hypothetical protein